MSTLLRQISIGIFLFSSACSGDAADDNSGLGPGGKADGVGTTDSSFTLLQEGFFPLDSHGVTNHVPQLVHYGFIAREQADHLSAADWSEATDQTIHYASSANESNEAVTIHVSAEHADDILGYVFMYYETRQGSKQGGERWTEVQYVDLRDREGKFYSFPLRSFASYPFSDECYQIRVDNIGMYGPEFNGKIKDIFYGYTASTAADYRTNNDVAWENALGDTVAAGVLHPTYAHDGGYKGSYQIIPEWVRVPSDKNLVFKLGIDVFNGTCEFGDDTRLDHHAETQTYLLETMKP